jgi:hypothetical protein
MTTLAAAAVGVTSALLGAMCGVAVLNALTARRLRLEDRPLGWPRVSLLVPARDEEGTLGDTLPRMLASDYPELEVLVLDDESSDGTAALVESYARSDARLRLLRGRSLPAGWVGKCWACAQLAEAATGEILLFCDSDVRPERWAVTATVAAMDRAGAGVLSALPRQETRGLAESAVVPLVTQLPILALLPLRLAERGGPPTLCAGNGQWLAFTRQAYAACGGHAGVRGSVLEDVEIARAAKRAGVRVAVALAPRALAVRMYSGAREVRRGFRKNLYALAGGRPAAVGPALVLFAGTMVFPLAAPALAGAAGVVPLALLVALRAIATVDARDRWRSILVHPLGAVALPALFVDSVVASWRGRTEWKGRTIAQPAALAAISQNVEDR